MDGYQIQNVSFTYPGREKASLSDISFSVKAGEFITVCGKSGSGKTTLLRLLKTSLTPHGTLSGSILFNGKSVAEINDREQASQIGFVMQNPDNQIVTDKVWHELAFGLESLGYSTAEIRTRVSEMASFFGIQEWFHKKVTELSGGQKQLLNLASVMVMQPSVLILDEPTSQLDPIAAQEFLRILEKINREIGTSIILSEHSLEEAFPMSDRIIVLDDGSVIADDTPRNIGKILQNNDMRRMLPTPMRVFGAVENDLECPLTVREGREWLGKFSEKNSVCKHLIPKAENNSLSDNIVLELKDVWFRYDKKLPDVIRGLNMTVKKGELFAVVGGNGTGKTTALSLICGLYSPYRGKILINGEPISQIKNLYNGTIGMLAQNPQSLFVKKTVFSDLMEIFSEKRMSKAEKEERVRKISKLCRIDGLLELHPYDLSGGEQQRAALAKILLLSPEILLLDEPTKGMDTGFKEIFADILKDLTVNGVTVIMVSHDIEFCAAHADRCAMFFDGNVTSEGVPRKFFAGKSFYTTAANRMARACIPEAVLAEDIILACGGRVEKRKQTRIDGFNLPEKIIEEKKKDTKLTPKKVILGCIFAVLFVITCVFGMNKYTDWRNYAVQFATIAELIICLGCFLPQKEFGIDSVQQPFGRRMLTKRTIISALFVLLAIPLTIFIGTVYLDNKKYYFISLLIILEILVPFGMMFEGQKPSARELIVISVLCAIAVAGRAAFFMLPQFKPVAAVVIIAGVCFGAETGFLVGAMTAFVSNFFFGQGPWTPWQMIAFGAIGFFAGIFFRKGLLRKTKASLCIFGGLVTFIIYGGINNAASVVVWQDNPTAGMLISAYLMGIPFDLIHAASTVFFLWFISEPMIEKLDRVKMKYGMY